MTHELIHVYYCHSHIMYIVEIVMYIVEMLLQYVGMPHDLLLMLMLYVICGTV